MFFVKSNLWLKKLKKKKEKKKVYSTMILLFKILSLWVKFGG